MASLLYGFFLPSLVAIFASVVRGAPNLCFERVHNLATLNMVGHPASSSHAIIANKNGLIQLVEVPATGSNARLKVISTFLDVTSRAVVSFTEDGSLGIAFHPKFLQNGKFYVSYICNGAKFKDCQGPCACNSIIGCSLGELGASCYLNTVIAEYTVPNPRNVLSVPIRVESKRIMNYARPFANHNGGDIVFGNDGYLYITSGDGGNEGDPFNTAQNGKTLLGKILRIDVNKNSNGKNYSIPSDNPFVGNKALLPEIYALGLRNPWRCSFDSVTGAFFCGDVGNSKIEEVDRILPGYNYGWSRYEGTTLFKSSEKVPLGRHVEGPLFEYAHPGVSYPGIPQGGIAVIGGLSYRAPINKCLQGKYLYNDLAGAFWIGTVYTASGVKPYTSLVGTQCAPQSPYPCTEYNGRISFGEPWSWGSDSYGNAYALSSSGAYRLVALSKCSIAC